LADGGAARVMLAAMSEPKTQTRNLTALLGRTGGRAASPCDTCGARSSSFCDVLDEQEFLRLAAIVTSRAYEPGQMVVQEGDPADWLFNVISGTVKLYRALPDGRTQIVGFLGLGDFVGIPTASEYAVSAEAVSQVETCVFPRRAFDRLLADAPTLERRLFEMARNEVVAARDHMLLLGRKTAREKVASFLTALAAKPQCAHTARPCVDLPMTRTEIADYLGLTIETVSRTISRFRDEGLVVLETSDRLLLAKLDALRAIAAGED
jgi:CRP/FNR family transcriptional regulator